MNVSPTVPPPPFDAFESALLTRLRAVVAELPPVPVRPARLRRRWLTPAAVALVAAFALVLGVRALWPTPAFAVTGTNDTEVVVKVYRLDGVDALEAALAKRGVPADITYLPSGKQCAEGRYVDVTPRGTALSVSADRFWVTIPSHAVGPQATFVLSASVTPLPNGVRASVSYGIARGPVAPCRVVDAP